MSSAAPDEPSPAADPSPPSPSAPVARREKADFQAKVRDVPHRPGVYLMRDRLNRVIYVGKARDLRKRVSSYFLPSRQRQADLKTRALLTSVYDFEFHVVRSEPEALLLEGKLIKEFRPRYNISFRDDKRFLLVKVNVDDPIPRFQLTRLRKEDGARYFGPFAHSGALRATLGLMRTKFGLRSCRPYQPGEYDYKHCLAPVIKNCPAPCVGKISPEDYRARVSAACDFLEGHSREMVAELEKQMQAAAARLEFERAAELRDMVEDLRRTTAPTRRFTRHSLPSTVDPAADLRALGDALQLAHLPLVMECFDISNISTTHIVASMVSFKHGVPDKSQYRRYRIKGVQGQNDFASMAEVIRRRYARVLLTARALDPDAADFNQETNVAEALRALPRADQDGAPPADPSAEPAEETEDEIEAELERDFEANLIRADDAVVLPEETPGADPADVADPAAAGAADDAVTTGAAGKEEEHAGPAPEAGGPFVRLPDLVIVDGGKGQLSAACKELQRLGLFDLPIIGLAKEFEEIYRPGRPLPLRLPEDSGALRLLQRIRDEAHRFANGYHQLLMKRRVSESILDDCPGVSEHRKQILLRAFGSVERLRRTAVEQIAAVEGIGPRLAAEVHDFLQRHGGR